MASLSLRGKPWCPHSTREAPAGLGAQACGGREGGRERCCAVDPPSVPDTGAVPALLRASMMSIYTLPRQRPCSFHNQLDPAQPCLTSCLLSQAASPRGIHSSDSLLLRALSSGSLASAGHAHPTPLSRGHPLQCALHRLHGSERTSRLLRLTGAKSSCSEDIPPVPCLL